MKKGTLTASVDTLAFKSFNVMRCRRRLQKMDEALNGRI